MSVGELIERALAYRGYVTVARRDGSLIAGYVYDRGPSHVDMFDETATERIRIQRSEIADIAFTGEDTAAKAQKVWEKKHVEIVPERPVLLVVALPIELKGVAKVLDGKVRGDTVLGRLGDRPAIARAIGLGGGAGHVIAGEKPRRVFSCGLSGGLQPTLAPGSIVLATAVRDELGESVVAQKPVLKAARQALEDYGPVNEGEIVSATAVVATRAEKLAIGGAGRLAVDLESWSAARAAERANIPWLAVRVVVDPLDAELPEFARNPHDGYWKPALRHAITGPGALIDLIRLGLRADTAMRALQQALRFLAPALAHMGGRE
jgi:hypothetical protein